MATDYSDLFSDTPTAPAANLNLRFGVEANPDQAAEAAKLARRYRLPVGVVSEFRDDYRQKAQVDDARQVVEQSPKLRDWLAADVNNAGMAHDDVQTLGGIEQAVRTLKSVPSAVASGFPRMSAGFYGFTAAPFEAAGQVFGGAEDWLAGLMGAQGYKSSNAGQIIGGTLRGIAQDQERFTKQVYTPAADAGIIERGVGSGLQSAVQSVVSAPFALRQSGEQAALALMGATTFGSSYLKATDKGKTPLEAIPFASADAVAEVVTEKYFGFSGLMAQVRAGSSAAKMFVYEIVKETPGEIGATIWQNFNEWMSLNPDKSVSEWFAEQPEAIGETIVATLVGGGAQIGAIKGTQKVLGRMSGEEGRAQQAEQQAAAMEQLAKLGTASKLNARDATTFKALVSQIADEEGDAPTQFFIDPATLVNSLNQSGITAAELESIAPTVAQQLQAPTGGDIRVPVSEFLLAGEELTVPLIDHLRTSEDAMTRAEATEYLKTQGDTIRADVEAELQGRDDQEQFRQSIDGVRTQFETELNNAKRFTPAVNKAYSELLANFYGATASRLGMTPEALLDKYKLRVQAQGVAGERTLNQVDTATPEFSKWFGESKVTDAGGKPLVVYHGTTGDITQFDASRRGENTGAESAKAGFFFTDDTVTAESYAHYAATDAKIAALLKEAEAAESRGDWDAYDAKVQEYEALDASFNEPSNRLGGQNTVPVYLSMQNPLRVDAKGENAAGFDIAAAVKKAIRGKYDGLIIENLDDAAGLVDRPANHYVAFAPTQIKSATGNRGTFDPNDANILNQSALPAAESTTDENGNPEINSADVRLMFAQPTERFEFIPEAGQQMYNMAIMSPAGDYLGYVEMVYEGGKPTALYDIEVNKDTRMAGTGAKVIEAILAANPDQGILISNVVPAARGFWEKVGVPQQNVGEGDAYDGTLDWNTYAASPAGRKSLQARRDAGAGGGNPGGAEGSGTGPVSGVPGQGEGLSQGGKLSPQSRDFLVGLAAVARDALAGQRNSEAVLVEAQPDGLPVGPENLSNLPEGQAPAPVQEGGLGGGPALVAMLAHVRRAVLNDPQVLDAVVGAVPVDVVNNLFGSESAAKVALHDQAMLKDSAAFDAELSVAGGLGDAASSVGLLVREATGRAAELARVSLRSGVEPKELLAAADTRQGNTLNQGESPRAQISFANDITLAPSVISLLASADLSGFLHESGHFFLEVQSDLATRIQQQIDSGASVTPAERGIVDDMNRLLEWFGVKGNENQTALTEWSTMTLDQKREHHETFARGFERFTMEGKAPSIALQEVFSRFRSWLVQVYKTLRGLNVELNDDVRAVMGRMLATDFAIEEAEAQRAMGPLFKGAESAGMTLDEFSAYQATAQGATDKAAAELQVRGMKDMKWLSRARDKALKARQQEVDELRREIKNEVRSEVMAEPVYQAWQFLTGKQQEVIPGAQPVDEIDTVQQSGKLRTQVLRDMYGTEETAVWRELSARRMTSDTSGMHPEIVAEMFGYDSADALVKTLAEAMPPAEVIDARTDQRMLEMFGDITSEEALQRAADEAVHNEARARFIATEMKALEAANKVTQRQGKTTVNVLARAAKDYAQQIIARLKVREIRPNQYATAEARNAKLAQKAFMAGKTEEAALHKRNQLVNNYATRAAYDAQAEVKSAQKYFRKFDKRSKAIDAGYQDQIEQMLERFDFRQASIKEIDRRKSFAAWVEEQRADGIEPSVPAELLDEANRKSYKDMTIEEIRGLRETIEQIEHLGRLKNKLLLARDKRDFDEIAADIAASIIKYGGKKRPLQLEGPNPAADLFDGFAAQHRKIASLIRQMDGNQDNGPLYEHLGRAMNERGTLEDVMVEKATMDLQKLYAPMLKLKGGITGSRSKVFIPEINASLTRGGRLAVALNWGNEANRQRIMDGDKWSEGQVRAILKTLTPTELEFVNGTWAYLDSFWPEVAAKEKRLTGVEPEKVEAQPFNVIAADGTEVAMRGGYYPLSYDSSRSDRSRKQEQAAVYEDMKRGAVGRATTRRGHTKERLKEVDRAVRKDLNVITQHVTQVVHDLAWHEWVNDANKILADKEITASIQDYYGPNVLDTMHSAIEGIATADVVAQTKLDAIMLHVRSNVTRATMGASLTTAFLQPFGLTQSMVRIGPKHVLRGLARWGGDAARMENTVGWIKEKSEFMRLRSKTMNKELREIRGSVAGKSKTMKVVDAGLFVMMQKMQLVADVPTWVGQYEKSLAEGLDEAAAVAMADRAVLESQGGGQTKDLAELQRKHPLLTQFYSYFSVTLNLAAEQTAATNFKNPAAVAGWLGDMALLMVIPAILPSFIMFALKGGDDDEEGLAKKLAEWQVGYLLGTVVGLREFSGGVGGFDYAGPPVGRVVGTGIKFGKQVSQGEIDEPLVLATIDLMGAVFGIPTIQATRSYKGWKAWDEEQEGAGPQSVLFGPPPKK